MKNLTNLTNEQLREFRFNTLISLQCAFDLKYEIDLKAKIRKVRNTK